MPKAPLLPAIAVEETRAAQATLANTTPRVVVRTPLVKLNYVRPDRPDLEIFLKLETLQPINSFKIRGAMNVIQSIPSEKLKHDFGNTVVSASAGNMGQGVAYAAKQRGARCVVVVPEHAPKAKTCVIEELHGGEIIRVPFARWWEILQSSDASLEMKGAPHMFVHPVSDRRVVAGNSTIGAEIVEDLPDVDAVFAPWGGGGLCCGIGSYLKSAVAKEDTSAGQLSTKRRRVGTKIDLVSCEPATACPLHTSLKEGQMCTNFAEYKASFIDGCGGKSVLSEMWPLAQELVSDARAVPLEDVKEAIRILAEKNKVIAEGAGAIALAAVLFGPREKLDGYRQVACVVCGGCIDKDVLIGILGSPSVPKALADGPPIPKVFSAADVAKLLPMAACIDAAAEALRAVAAGEGVMPVRSVLKLPVDKVAFLGTMPCFMDGLAAVKAITVLPGNRGTAFSSHQGSVLLFNAKNHGELLAISDAHEITKIRTAAASAAATRAIFTRHAKAAPSTLAIVGAGQQAHSHCEAMLSLFNESIRDILVFGRNVSAIEACVEEIRRKYPSKLVSHFLMSEMSSHMPRADIICTVTSAGAAFLKLAHLKPTAHICAVGACQPQFAEIDTEVLQAVDKIYCDTKAACMKEPGDILNALKSCAIDPEKLMEIGGVIDHHDAMDPLPSSKITLFKSLGCALEDLTAARLVYENSKR